MTTGQRIVVLCLAAAELPLAVACAEVTADSHPPITCVVISADGRRVIDGSQDGIRIRSWEQLQTERTLPPPFSQIHDLQLSPDESVLVVVGGEPGISAIVAAYAWPALQILWWREFSEDVAYSLDFAVDGHTIAVAAHDHQVYLLDRATGDIKSTLSGHSKPVMDVMFLADGKTVITASLDQTIRVWNSPDRSIIRSLNNHTRSVMDVALRPGDGGRLPMIASAGEDRTVRLWQPTIGRLVRFQRFDTPVNALTFDATGNFVLAGGRDGSLRIVDVDSLAARTISNVAAGWINCLAAHPQETFVVVGGSDGSVRKVNLTAVARAQ